MRSSTGEEGSSRARPEADSGKPVWANILGKDADSDRTGSSTEGSKSILDMP